MFKIMKQYIFLNLANQQVQIYLMLIIKVSMYVRYKVRALINPTRINRL